MRHARSLLTYVVPISSLVLGVACMEPRYPDDFDDTTQAAWAADATVIFPVGADAGVASPPSGFFPSQPVAPSGLVDAGAVDAPQRVPDAGPGVGFPTRPDAGAVKDSGSPTFVDAGSTTEVDAGGEPPAGGTVTSCAISASTDANDSWIYTGKYGCGVWIANSSGKAVKVFMVATRISNRSGLSAYRTATSGVTVDVTASATLSSAKQHSYTWDLKDMSGSAVPPGSYKLTVETHSGNGTNLVTVPFDTSAGPVSETGKAAGDIRSASIKCD